MAKKAKWLTKGLLMGIVVVSIFMINAGRPQAMHDGYTNYYGVEMTDDEYLTLVNLGFTDDEIYLLSEDEFEKNKDLDATLLAVNHKYFQLTQTAFGIYNVTEVTEQQFLQQTTNPGNQPLGEVFTSYLHEVSTISQNGAKYRYKDSTSWYSIPDNKSYDVTGIGFVDSVYINSTVYFKYVYADVNGNYTSSTLYYDKKSTAYGGSAVYKIPSQFTITALSSTIYFDVSKNTNDTLTNLTFCGDYAHSLQTVTSTQAANHNINAGGINFDASVYNYFNQIPCATASVDVIW